MTEPGQSIESGDESVVLVAGRDLVLGVAREDVRELARTLFSDNMVQLRQVAEEIAYARADFLVNQYLDKLRDKDPRLSSQFQDPDIQVALSDAQRAYARSGEEDLADVLSDLLVARTEVEGRDLRPLALNAAIESVPKLTEGQRRAVAIVFVLMRTRTLGLDSIDAYMDKRIRGSVVPLTVGVADRAIDYQHMEYVGVGSISMGSTAIGRVLRAGGAEGLFTRGVAPEDVPDPIRTSSYASQLLMPCIRDSSRLQLSIIDSQEIPNALERLGCPEILSDVTTFAKAGELTDAEVAAEVVEREPSVAQLIEVWESTPLKNFNLTSVGVAIGYSYWKRLTGFDADLGIWL